MVAKVTQFGLLFGRESSTVLADSSSLSLHIWLSLHDYDKG